jgi:twinkle protein
VTKQVDLQPDTHRLDRYRQLWQAGKKCGVPDRVITPEHGGYFGLVDTGTEYLFPYFNSMDPEPCGFKIRRKDAKQFSTVGDMKEAMLFGSNKVGSGVGKNRVLVTEGEFDAMAARQMVQGGMTVVSLSKGASSVKRDFKTSYDWLDGFDEIIVAFDADEAGQKAVTDAADIFGGKLKVVKMDPSVGKDACDYLVNKQSAVFKDLCYAASPFTPAGVLSTDELWERLNRERPDAMGDYPWASLNALTYGFRPTELVTICAGSGLGKSSILREIVMHVKDNTDNKIGVLFMEESVERTAEGFMGVDLSTPVHLPTSYVKRGDEEYKQSFNRVFGDGQLSIMDASFDTGATVDQVVSRVRFMAKALDCKVIVLDHISILVSGGQYGDERRALDEIMTKLRTLTQDTGIVLFAVSHLKRPDGKGHEEGAATSVAQLRGSASIAQLSDFVIGLERNGQAEDETERNTTHMRVLKNRFSGITGPAGHLLYQPDTGRLVEYFPEEAQEDAL